MNAVDRPEVPSSLRTRRPRFHLGIWAIAALFLLSAGTYGLGGYVSPAVAPIVHASPHSAPLKVTPVAPVLTATAREEATLPGSTVSNEAFFDAPSLAASAARHNANVSLSAASPAGAAQPAAGAAHVAPSVSFPTGTFTGYVNTSESPQKGIPSVSVAAYSLQGAYCPSQTCATVATNATGYFSVNCPVGQDYVQASTNFRVTNLTFATCRQATTTYIGTIFLIQTAYLTAVVEGDDSSHEKVPGVTVCSTDRTVTVIASPCGTTDIYGSLNHSQVAVPPLPSRVDFSPPPGYLANFTYTNATPGASVYLGVVYLERLVVVRAELYDEVTKGPIGTQASLTVCQSLTVQCQQQGQLAGSTVVAFGQPGNSFVEAQATGYVADQHPVGIIPKLGPGKVYDVGRIYLIPDAGVNLNIGITHNHGSFKWPTSGGIVVSISSLDGYSAVGLNCNIFGQCNTTTLTTWTAGCTGINQPAVFGSTPLRVSISLAPDYNAICNGFFPTWPIPGFEPVWGNTTMVNLTPRLELGAGAPIELDMTPGTYISGNVTSPGLTTGLASYQVTAQSTNTPTITQYSYTFTGDPNTNSPWECGSSPIAPPSGSKGHTFCAPAPPGPVKITATSAGFETNYTWATSTMICCNTSQEPLPLGSANLEKFSTINLTGPGKMWGHVFEANNSTVPVNFGSFQVCSASANPNLGCWTGAITVGGYFSTPAPLGWDWIRISASGFSPNLVWADITSNSSVGNVTLTPLATIAGQVVDQNGVGIVAASIQECQLATPQAGSCQPFGSGLASTDGHYLGTIVGGWLPWTTFRMVASAAGYTSDWAWVNASAGNLSITPTLTLHQIGTNTSAAPLPTSVGVWVDGRVTDAQSGWGIQPSTLQACPTDGGACTLFTDGANPGGYYNNSVTPGVYNLTISTQGYYNVNFPFNASGAGFVHLGDIQMTPYGFVSGRAALLPWEGFQYTVGHNTYTFNMFPGATAVGCDNAGLTCGAALQVDSLGYFNVSAPAGVYDNVRITGLYPGGGPSAVGGFIPNGSTFNTTGFYTEIDASNPVLAPIFGAVAGLVWDNSTFSNATNAPTMPVHWPTVTEITIGVAGGTVGGSAGGGGNYVYLIAPGNPNGSIYVTASLPLAYYTMTVRVWGIMQPAGFLIAPPINMSRYGWIDAQLVSSTTGVGAPFVPGTATFVDRVTGNEFQTTGPANGGGFLNMSAPVGSHVIFTAGPGYDFNFSKNYTVWVNQSSTGFPNGTSDPPALGTIPIEPWGTVRSVEVNTSLEPVLTTVIDKTNHLPIPFASVTVSSSDNVQAGSSQDTNWFGQFVSDAPVGGHDTLQVSHEAFITNDTFLPVAPGEQILIPTVNLTAHGVLAGRVIAYPSGLPIAGALITACPPSSSLACTSGISNESGVFWVNAVPGINDITITANGYVSNTSVVARAYSDTWIWIGTQVLNEFANVFGFVRGLPSGLPVVGATVAVCSPLGSPTGPCGFFVTTGPAGNFLLTAPPGNYVLRANDTNYNSTYLPLSLSPGQTVNVGVLFLPQFGALVGTVVSALSLAPVSGAQVLACPDWQGSACIPVVNTTSNGQFVVYGAPGPYELSIAAAGYADAFVPVHIVSGITTSLFNIQLQPLSTALSYSVSGVVTGLGGSSPLSGALVSAIVNGTPAFATVTDTNGLFDFQVLYGSYTLHVALPGWAPYYAPLTVHAPIAGLAIDLSPMTYPVTGRVLDGITGGLVQGGVLIEEAQVQIGASDPSSGVYTVMLTNGSHALTAIGPSQYSPLPFVVVVNGIGFTRDVTLYPPITDVFGTVVDSTSGLPINAAIVVVSGISENVPIANITLTTNPAGQFSVDLPQGSYTVNVVHDGYASVRESVTASGVAGPQPLTVSMTPNQSPAPTSGMGPVDSTMARLWTIVLVIAAVGACVAVAVYLGRKKRAAAAKSPAPKPSSGGRRT